MIQSSKQQTETFFLINTTSTIFFNMFFFKDLYETLEIIYKNKKINILKPSHFVPRETCCKCCGINFKSEQNENITWKDHHVSRWCYLYINNFAIVFSLFICIIVNVFKWKLSIFTISFLLYGSPVLFAMEVCFCANLFYRILIIMLRNCHCTSTYILLNCNFLISQNINTYL